MDNSESARKPAKGRGIDPNSARRVREERAVQIRKEKRFDRANIERRKFKEDDSVGSLSGTPAINKGNTYSILPKKCNLLVNGTAQEVLESAMFFRRILAADKHPPLDMIVETGVVIPTLINLLSQSNSLQLQIESAWCLTNIACGEPRHVHYLISVGALQQLIDTVTTTQSTTLKDQALWAISNMTAIPEACEFAATLPNFLVLMLKPVGLECEIKSPGRSELSNTFATPQCVLQRIYQGSIKEPPTLSAMRYVTFICGNLARLKAPLPNCWYRMLVFTMSELVHSPDDEIVLDICACLITLLQDHSDLTAYVMELGFPKKMKENIDSLNPASPAYELSLLVLCALLRSPNVLHRTVVLSLTGSGYQVSSTSPTSDSLFKISPGFSNSSAAQQQQTHQHEFVISGTVTPVNSFTFGAGVSTPSGGFSFGGDNLQPSTTASAGNSIGGSEVETGAVVVPPSSVLVHLVRHLGRTDNALSQSDICRSLLGVVDMGVLYAEVCVACGLDAVLERLLESNAYELKIDAGELLCALVQTEGIRFTPVTLHRRTGMLKDILTVQEPNLLVNSIWALKSLITYAIMHQADLPYKGEIRDHVDVLVTHPVPQISDLACSLDDLLSNCEDEDGDFDFEGGGVEEDDMEENEY